MPDFDGLGLSSGIETDLLIIILGFILALMIGLFILVIKRVFLSSSIEKILSRYIKEGKYKETIQAARDYLDKKPSRFFVLYYLAEAYEKTDNLINAVKFYVQASNSLSRSHRMYKEILIKIASIYNRLGKPKEAVAYYLMVIEDDPGYSEAGYEIAKYHYNNKHYKKAREYLELILKKRPGLIDARFLYGKLLYETANYSGAIKQFELLEKYDPENPEIYYYKAQTLESTKHYTSAIDFYKKALEFENLSANIRDKIYLSVTRLYIKLKNYYTGIEAIPEFLNGVKDDIIIKELLYLYANMLWNTSEEYQSLKNYERVYKMDFQFKDIQVIYEKYKSILPHSFLSFYFTGNEDKFLLTCQNILGSQNFNIQHRSLDFYIFSKGVFSIIFYRHIEPINFSKLTDMEIMLNSAPVSPQGVELYTLQGISDEAVTHALLKKAQIITGDEFIGVVKKSARRLE